MSILQYLSVFFPAAGHQKLIDLTPGNLVKVLGNRDFLVSERIVLFQIRIRSIGDQPVLRSHRHGPPHDSRVADNGLYIHWGMGLL